MNATQHALRWLDIFGARKTGSRRSIAKRRARLRDAAREGLRRADEEAVKHLSRDYRGSDYTWDLAGRPGTTSWRKWTPDLPYNIGSGRAAEWCHAAYLRYACFAETIHRTLGWSGQIVRDAARATNAASNVGLHIAGLSRLPDEAMDGLVGRIRAEGKWMVREGLSWGWEWAAGPWAHQPKLSREDAIEKLCWMAFLELVLQPAWGRLYLEHQLEELRQNPTKLAQSMLVGEVRRLRGADVTDFRGCSGCEDLAVLHERPEVHDFILSRARESRRIEVNGRVAYEVPFGLVKPVGYTECVVLGIGSEIVCRSEDRESLGRAALGMRGIP